MNLNLESKTIGLRLVNIDDATFICSLRNNPTLNRHISKTTSDVEMQEEWIRQYKKRESKQQEYYFIIYRKDTNEPIGTVRLYDFISDINSFCWGSWILNNNKTRYSAIESALLVYKFAFEELKFKQSHFDVRKDNLGVHKFHIRLGAIQTHSNDLDNFYIFKSSTYSNILNDYAKFLL